MRKKYKMDKDARQEQCWNYPLSKKAPGEPDGMSAAEAILEEEMTDTCHVCELHCWLEISTDVTSLHPYAMIGAWPMQQVWKKYV